MVNPSSSVDWAFRPTTLVNQLVEDWDDLHGKQITKIKGSTELIYRLWQLRRRRTASCRWFLVAFKTWLKIIRNSRRWVHHLCLQYLTSLAAIRGVAGTMGRVDKIWNPRGFSGLDR